MTLKPEPMAGDIFSQLVSFAPNEEVRRAVAEFNREYAVELSDEFKQMHGERANKNTPGNTPSLKPSKSSSK